MAAAGESSGATLPGSGGGTAPAAAGSGGGPGGGSTRSTVALGALRGAARGALESVGCGAGGRGRPLLAPGFGTADGLSCAEADLAESSAGDSPACSAELARSVCRGCGLCGGAQPFGGTISTKLPHFGHSRMAPMAASLRTASRARQVVQSIENKMRSMIRSAAPAFVGSPRPIIGASVPSGGRSTGAMAPRREARRIPRECESGDLNPDPFRDWILSPARLPIPPLSRSVRPRRSRSRRGASGVDRRAQRRPLRV